VTLDPDVNRSRCTRSRSLSPGSVSGNATTKPRKHEEKREEEYVFFVFVDFRVFVVAFRQELEQLATMSREQRDWSFARAWLCDALQSALCTLHSAIS